MAFERHLAAFTDALGVENAPAIVYFSMVPWTDDEERNDFIRDLTNISMRDLNDYDRA